MRAGRCAPRVAVNKQVRLSSWRRLAMRNRRLCFVLVSLISAALSVRAQDAFRSASVELRRDESISADGDQLPEPEPVVVSATRLDIRLDRSPASRGWRS